MKALASILLVLLAGCFDASTTPQAIADAGALRTVTVAEVVFHGSPVAPPSSPPEFSRPWPNPLRADPANETLWIESFGFLGWAQDGDFVLVGHESLVGRWAIERPCHARTMSTARIGFQVEGVRMSAEPLNERLLSFSFAGYNHPDLHVRRGEPLSFTWNTTIPETSWNRTTSTFTTAQVPYSFDVEVRYHGQLVVRPAPHIAKVLAEDPIAREETSTQPAPPDVRCNEWPGA